MKSQWKERIDPKETSEINDGKLRMYRLVMIILNRDMVNINQKMPYIVNLQNSQQMKNLIT